MPVKSKSNLSEWLIRLLAEGDTHEVFHGHGFSLGLPSFTQKPADLGQPSVRPRPRVIMRAAGPKGVFVELNPLARGLPIHHRAESAAADGYGLDPSLRRSVEPNAMRGMKLLDRVHEPFPYRIGAASTPIGFRWYSYEKAVPVDRQLAGPIQLSCSFV
mgnify:CR=1 FL=1